MGFFDKVKNMFTEEVEDDDVKVEQIKKEVTHVAIKSPKVEQIDYENSDFTFRDEEAKPVPVFFDDNDFKDLNFAPRKEEIKPVIQEKETYGSKINMEKKEEIKKAFKPTPIISPVYGILDKNYHKEDIVSRNDYRSTTIDESEVSIDSIRNKAYGTLEDELENTLFGRNSILFKKEEEDFDNTEITEISDDTLSSLTDDISKELDELLIKKEKYSDEEIKKNIKNDDNLDEDDLLGFIDSTLYKESEE